MNAPISDAVTDRRIVTVRDLVEQLIRLPMDAKIGVRVITRGAMPSPYAALIEDKEIQCIEPANLGAMQGISATDWRLTLGGSL